jgi:hypothetical protein
MRLWILIPALNLLSIYVCLPQAIKALQRGHGRLRKQIPEREIDRTEQREGADHAYLPSPVSFHLNCRPRWHCETFVAM